MTPSVRDVVVSGGDLTNLPWPRLEEFLDALMDIESIRDIRLASKGLMSLPQHWLSDEMRRGVERMAAKAFDRGISLAIHTHVNAASQVTGLFAEAARAMAEAGIHHIRNQGVLLRGVNSTPEALLDLCFALLDTAGVTPYYFYLRDMIPASEHWRMSVGEAQSSSTPSWATCRDSQHRDWFATFPTWASAGSISWWSTTASVESPTGHELSLAGQAWWEWESYVPIHGRA